MNSMCPWCKNKNHVNQSAVNQCDQCQNYFALVRPFCQSNKQCTCVNFLGPSSLHFHPLPLAINENDPFPLFKMHSGNDDGRGFCCTDCGAGIWGTNFAHIQSITNWDAGSRPFDGYLVYKVIKVENFRMLHGAKRGSLASFLKYGFLPPLAEEGRPKSNGFSGENDLRYTTSSLSVAIEHAGKASDPLIFEIQYSGYIAQTNLEIGSYIMNQLINNLPQDVGGVAYAWEDGFFFRSQAALSIIGEIPTP